MAEMVEPFVCSWQMDSESEWSGQMMERLVYSSHCLGQECEQKVGGYEQSGGNLPPLCQWLEQDGR